MSDQENIIRLAEWMGWKKKRHEFFDHGVAVLSWRWIDPEGSKHKEPPDPYTDANDDYAILEKMRDHKDFDLNFWAYEYHIGDYANAALEVIDQEKTNEH